LITFGVGLVFAELVCLLVIEETEEEGEEADSTFTLFVELSFFFATEDEV